MNASENGFSGIFIDGDSAVVRSSTARDNNIHGIHIDGSGAKIGRLPGKPKKHANTANTNGYVGGVADGEGVGILVLNFTVAPRGKNVAQGNDGIDCRP